MSVWQFLIAWWTVGVDLIRAIAWPFTVLVGILLLRAPLTKMLNNLQAARWGGAEVVFQEAVLTSERLAEATYAPPSDDEASVQNESHKTPSPSAPDPDSATPSYSTHAASSAKPKGSLTGAEISNKANSLRSLARENGLIAINFAMGWIRRSLRNRLNLEYTSDLSVPELASKLKDQGVISEDSEKFIRSLQSTANAARLVSIFSGESALQFIDLVERAVIIVEQTADQAD